MFMRYDWDKSGSLECKEVFGILGALRVTLRFVPLCDYGAAAAPMSPSGAIPTTLKKHPTG